MVTRDPDVRELLTTRWFGIWRCYPALLADDAPRSSNKPGPRTALVGPGNPLNVSALIAGTSTLDRPGFIGGSVI